MLKVIDSIIGHAVGDAMGVPTEFCIREKLQAKPLTTMIGYRQHNVPEGSWSDDTSMVIATIDSIINKRTIDYEDIMTNFYYWLHDAKYTPGDEVFGVGRTCMQSIINFSKGMKSLESGQTSISSNGNGSLMRILPVALYSYYKQLSEAEIIELTNNMSSLTHAHEISKLGCYIYVRYIMLLLDGKSKEEAYKQVKMIDYSSYSDESLKYYERILKSNINEYELKEISSKGYVVDTLEAVFWTLLKHDNYHDTIIEAINLGNDTDTVGAIVGSMAGILYGFDNISKEWIDKLIKKDYLLDLAKKFEEVIK